MGYAVVYIPDNPTTDRMSGQVDLKWYMYIGHTFSLIFFLLKFIYLMSFNFYSAHPAIRFLVDYNIKIKYVVVV